jgi:hypothetical protein
MPGMMEMSGSLQVELDRIVIDLLDRAFAAWPSSISADMRWAIELPSACFVAPARDVEDHVVGIERVAIVPGHALAHVEDIFGRVLVDLPALEQIALEGEIAGVFDQRLEHLALDVGDLRPVGRARIASSPRAPACSARPLPCARA